jgi:large subunit ribosomal protein L4
MMYWDLIAVTGEKIGEIPVPDVISEVTPRVDILHNVVRWQLHHRRSFTAHVKGWSEVSGGGRKPWRQKGTGRARHGSIRSPLWKGGAKVHGPNGVPSSFDLPKKVRKLGLRMALKDRTVEGRIKVVRGLEWETPSAKRARQFLETLGCKRLFLVLGNRRKEKGVPSPVELSFRNLERVKVLEIGGLNVYDILWSDMVVFTEDAMPLLGDRLAFPNRERKALIHAL